jgi:hypothetical protein
VFGAMSIEVTDFISLHLIYLPSEICLHWNVACSVFLFTHDGLVAHDCGGWIFDDAHN